MAVEKKALVTRGPSVFAKIGTFFTESWHELQKVSWPSKAEVRSFTLVVITSVILVGLWLYCWDQLLGRVTKWILGE
jgi:preprotein translocase subunit SecE